MKRIMINPSSIWILKTFLLKAEIIYPKMNMEINFLYFAATVMMLNV